MKAAVIYENGGPDALRYEEVPDPECMDGCVLIEVEAVSIEGGDLLARAASPPASTPHVVGYLCAGTVLEAGAGVESPAVGDRVVTLNMDGSHAERRVAPAIMTWPIPDGLDPAAAACIPVAFGTAQECLFERAALQAGQSVLVHAGAGGVGMAAIQLASRAGATVYATASSQEKLDRLGELGLDHGINYAEENFVHRVKELTEGQGVDVALDSVGGKTLSESVKALAFGGSLVSVGVAGRAGSEVEAMSLWWRNNTLHGVYLAAELMADQPRVHAMIAELIDRVAAGDLHVEIDRSFSLAEAAAAHAYIESRNAFGRVVLTP